MRKIKLEKAFTFKSENNTLVGVIHLPEKIEKTGVLIVVGGPQTRVGSHRQFVLLARCLSDHNIPVFRFDYHGMGDSDGDLSSFEDCEKDINSAIDIFFESVPELESVVLWGLCDAAAASVFYAPQDDRVKGLVLLNPWARTEEGEAKAFVKHYYLSRLLDKGLWKKLLSGKFNFSQSIASLVGNLKKIFTAPLDQKTNNHSASLFDLNIPLPDRLYQGLSRFKGEVLIIISGDDLTAAEFLDVASSSESWKTLMNGKRITQRIHPDANHTFSRRAWRGEVEKWTWEWLNEKIK